MRYYGEFEENVDYAPLRNRVIRCFKSVTAWLRPSERQYAPAAQTGPNRSNREAASQASWHPGTPSAFPWRCPPTSRRIISRAFTTTSRSCGSIVPSIRSPVKRNVVFYSEAGSTGALSTGIPFYWIILAWRMCSAYVHTYERVLVITNELIDLQAFEQFRMDNSAIFHVFVDYKLSNIRRAAPEQRAQEIRMISLAKLPK